MEPETTTREATVLAAFLQWGKRRSHLPISVLRAAVRQVDSLDETVAISTWTGHRRTISARERPARSGQDLAPPKMAAPVDPWDEEGTSDIEARTRQTFRCSKCLGEASVVCVACNGTLVAACEDCRGSGRVRSEKTGRPVNCRHCRGEGRRKCKCRNGKMKCPTCDGESALERWLEVQQTPFMLTRRLDDLAKNVALPSSDPAAPHAGDLSWASEPGLDWQGADPAHAPASVQAWLARSELQPGLDQQADRVEGVSLRVWRRPVDCIEYRLGGKTGGVTFTGTQCFVVEQTADCKPFSQFWRLVLISMACGLLVGLAGWGSQVLRHPFFATTSISRLLLALAPAPALGFAAGAAALLLPNAVPWIRRLRIAAAGALALLLVLHVTLRLADSPSVEHATSLYAGGKTTEAKLEAEAAVAVGKRAEPARLLLDRMRLDELLALKEVDAALRSGSDPFHAPQDQQAADGHVLSLVASEVAELQAAGSYDQADALLRRVPPRLQGDGRLRAPRLQAAMHRMDVAIAALDLAGTLAAQEEAAGLEAEKMPTEVYRDRADSAAIERLKRQWADANKATSLADKIQKARELRPIFDFSDKAGRGGVAQVVTRAVFEATLKRWEADLEKKEAMEAAAEEARQKAEERRQAAEEARLERQRQAEEQRERWASGSARCCDGAISPSCGCGGGPGCCSRHGGVCGCAY